MKPNGLPSTHRPEQIAIWIQNRHCLPSHRQIIIKDLGIFVAAFWKWWDAINPPWRIRVDGRLKVGGAGSWASLHKPGQNGFLSVLQCLSWWRGLLDAGAEDWDSAVEDVVWVLKEVLNSLINSSSKCIGKRIRDTGVELSVDRVLDDESQSHHASLTCQSYKR